MVFKYNFSGFELNNEGEKTPISFSLNPLSDGKIIGEIKQLNITRLLIGSYMSNSFNFLRIESPNSSIPVLYNLNLNPGINNIYFGKSLKLITNSQYRILFRDISQISQSYYMSKNESYFKETLELLSMIDSSILLSKFNFNILKTRNKKMLNSLELKLV